MNNEPNDESKNDPQEHVSSGGRIIENEHNDPQGFDEDPGYEADNEEKDDTDSKENASYDDHSHEVDEKGSLADDECEDEFDEDPGYEADNEEDDTDSKENASCDDHSHEFEEISDSNNSVNQATSSPNQGLNDRLPVQESVRGQMASLVYELDLYRHSEDWQTETHLGLNGVLPSEEHASLLHEPDSNPELEEHFGVEIFWALVDDSEQIDLLFHTIQSIPANVEEL